MLRVLWLISSVMVLSAYASLGLTQEEQVYLHNKKEIVICDYADWMPYIGYDESHTFGIIYDYYKAFGASMGVPMRFVHKSGLQDCVNSVTTGSVDAVVSMGSPNTFADITLSDEYGSDFVALVTALQTPFVNDIKVLEGKAVGVIANYKNMIAYLHQTYPDLKFQLVHSIEEGFEKVANGGLYAFIDTYRVAAYTIQREHIGKLKINTKVPQLMLHAHVGLRKDNTILKQIFNKAIASLSTEERHLMIHRWMRAEHVIKRDYNLLSVLVIFFLFIVLFLLYRQYQERQRQEVLLEKQAKLAGMGTMINNIAHQWRQPLNRINSNIAVMNTVLDSEKLDSKMMKEKMSNIKENTKYMSDTIEDFIHFFHPNKAMETFLIEEMVGNTLNLMGTRLKDVEVEFLSTANVYIHSFENELQQVLLIVLHNAVDQLEANAVEHPKIKIEIIEENTSVHMGILDNGGGVAPKELDKIFEPYYTTKFANEGSGLGLYMAKMLVESSMGGHLSVCNKEEGAYFEIVLKKGEKHG